MRFPSEASSQALPFDAAAFFAHSKDVCVAYDAARRFAYLNPRALALTGKPLEQLIGRSPVEVYGERASDIERCLAQAVETGEGVPVVHKLRDPSGTAFYFDTMYTPVRGASGAVTYVMGIGRDVTDLSRRWRELQDTVAKRTRDLQETHARFDVLAQNLQIGVLIRGPQAEVRYFNARLLELFGMTEDQLNRRVPYDPGWRVVGEDGQPLTHDQWPTQRALSTALPVQGVVIGIDRPRHGDRVWLLANVVIQRNAQGELEQTIGTFSDITGARRAAQELADRERMFRLIAETISDVFWVYEARLNKPIYVSPAYETIWGRSRKEFCEREGSFIDSVHPDDQDRVRAALPLQATGEYDIEYRAVRPDGTIRWVRDRAFPVKDASGELIQLVGLATDITEHKEAERLIRSQAAALRELSTPLVPISAGVLAMPLVGVLDSARVRQVLETLLEGIVKHAAEVVILDVTGVGIVDTAVANALMQATQAAKLLGAEVVLTGIRPDVAGTIVSLGVDLPGLVTHGTLETAIAYALRRSSRTSRAR
nr:PAS domain S-box protein [Polyangium aurulentum]